MKLSEAILLGSTVLAAKPGGQYFAETEAGCALGMAAIANGCSFRHVTGPVAENDRRTLGAEGVWGTWVLRVVMRPCECTPDVPREMRIKDIIAHLFDVHVVGKKDWTPDRLVAWVQAWEPDETSRIANLPQDLQERIKKATWTRIPTPRAPESREQAISPGPRGEDRQAEQEWQRVRQTFEARHKARRSIPGGMNRADGQT